MEVFNGNLREASLAKSRGNFLHLNRYSGILISECNVIATNVNKAERIAVILKVEVKLFCFGLCGVFKVHESKAAKANSQLVHKTARLTKVNVFCVLAHLGKFNSRNLAATFPESFHCTAGCSLKRSRGRKSATTRDIANYCHVKAGWLKTKFDQVCCHTTNNSLSAQILSFGGL